MALAPAIEPKTLPIRESTDVVAVRQAARQMAIAIGFSLVDQTKIVTAASELARNTLEHGKGGSVRLECVTQSIGRSGLQLTFQDQGPGILDVQLAMTDGYTTGNGMGLGLSGSKRLMSDLTVASTPGQGTCVTTVRWK